MLHTTGLASQCVPSTKVALYALNCLRARCVLLLAFVDLTAQSETKKFYTFWRIRMHEAQSNPGTGDRNGCCAAYIHRFHAKPVPTESVISSQSNKESGN